MISKDYSSRDIVDVDLQKYGLVLKRRWPFVLVTCLVTSFLAMVYVNSKEATYEASAKVLVQSSSQASTLVGLEGGDRELKALTSQNNPLDTQVEIFNSIPTAQKVISKLNIRDKDDQPMDPEKLLSNLKVGGIPGTDVLQITYEHPDPEFAAEVVNTAIEAYLENNAQQGRKDAAAAQTFIAEQLPATEAKVKQAEAALRQFKEVNAVVDLDTESSNIVEVLTTLENSLTNLNAQLADSNARAASLQGKIQMSPQQAYVAGLVSDSPGVQEVLTQLQAVQAQLAVARTQYRENHPKIINLRAQSDMLNSLLNGRISAVLGNNQTALPSGDFQSGQLEQSLIAEYLQLEAQSQGLEQQIGQLSDALSAQQSRAQILPGLEESQRELSRRLTAAQTTYETLLDNLQQTQVIENQDLESARIVSPALVPRSPSETSKLLYLMAGGVAGSLLGIILAFLADFLDRSVKTVREGQELYGYPLLGVIPAWGKISFDDLDAPSLVTIESHDVPLIEAYQGLQSNLKFSYFDKPLKSIVITSAVSREGKSEITANLALTISQLGYKVLVIDADMRNPAQQNIWKISEPRGLSNLIAGQIALEQAIVKKTPNLHILPAGSIPPNPLAILESTQMADVIHACEDSYDYTIIDTPPILGSSDMPTVGRLADGVLLVMQTTLCNIKTIQAAKAVMNRSRQQVLGIVANGVDVKSLRDHYFYHAQEYVSSTNLLDGSTGVGQLGSASSHGVATKAKD